MQQNDVFLGIALAATLFAVLVMNSPDVPTETETTISQQSQIHTQTTDSTATTEKVIDMSETEVVNVTMSTNMGDIQLELYPEKAPITVANFVSYANDGFYNGTIFHRVIDGFMIQGGGFTEDFTQKPTGEQIQNEADNGLTNEVGSIAMARTPDPHSATAQFFINVNDNDFLNFRSADMNGYGYAVFGKVTSGMDVVDQIKAVPTGAGGPMPSDVPQTTVTINSVTVD